MGIPLENPPVLRGYADRELYFAQSKERILQCANQSRFITPDEVRSLNKFFELQNTQRDLFLFKDKGDSLEYLIIGLDLALSARQLKAEFPALARNLDFVIPRWLSGPLPLLDPQTAIPGRFKQAKTMLDVITEAIRREKEQKYKHGTKKKVLAAKPKSLNPEEYIYIGEIVAAKITQDGIQEEEVTAVMGTVINIMFALGAHPDTQLAQKIKSKSPASSTKTVNTGDLLVFLEDFTDQTHLALCDISDPRHATARRVFERLFAMDQKKAQHQPFGSDSAGAEEFSEVGLTCYLSSRDHQRKLNLIDYLSRLMDASLVTGDPWYDDLVYKIARNYRRRDIIVDFNRVLFENDLNVILNIPHWLKQAASLPDLPSILKTWRERADMALNLNISPDVLTLFNQHLFPSTACTLFELHYQPHTGVVNAELDFKTKPQGQTGEESLASDDHIKIKTTFIIDTSWASPFVFPDILGYAISEQTEQGLLALVSHVLNEEFYLRDQVKTGTQLPSLHPPAHPMPQASLLRPEPTPVPGHKKRTPKIPAETHIPSAEQIREESTPDRTNEGKPNIQILIPSLDDVQLPKSTSYAHIAQKIAQYNQGSTRGRIARQKGPNGERYLTLIAGDHRIIAKIVNGQAEIVLVEHRSRVYRNYARL